MSNAIINISLKAIYLTTVGLLRERKRRGENVFVI